MRVDMKEVLALLDSVKDGTQYADKLKALDEKEKAVIAKLGVLDSLEKVQALEAQVRARTAEVEAKMLANDEAAAKKERERKAAYQQMEREYLEKVQADRKRYESARTMLENAQSLTLEAEAAKAVLYAETKKLEQEKNEVTALIAKLKAKTAKIVQIMSEGL